MPKNHSLAYLMLHRANLFTNSYLRLVSKGSVYINDNGNGKYVYTYIFKVVVDVCCCRFSFPFIIHNVIWIIFFNYIHYLMNGPLIISLVFFLFFWICCLTWILCKFCWIQSNSQVLISIFTSNNRLWCLTFVLYSYSINRDVILSEKKPVHLSIVITFGFSSFRSLR